MASPFLHSLTREAIRMKHLTPLPFDHAWSEIKMTLGQHRNLVLVAEPGAGKTTRFPAMLIEDGIVETNTQVAVLEPRRLAARAAATRIASEREWPMKSKVGYSVRFDHQMTESTRLAFFTEGLFLKRLASNPSLKGIDCVILDEFHERSRYTDLAIAALKELQYLERPDLRIVVMSATIDADKISEFLAIDGKSAPIVRVPGRTFPVAVRYSSEPLSLRTTGDGGREWIERISKLVKSVALGPNDRIGDILVFLPGVGEIRRLEEALLSDSNLNRVFQILELHGSLSLEDQSKVLTPNASDSRPRVILSTNIAETSLTLDGVGTVIDTGLQRVARADKLGFSQLHLERISLASAKQRTGRAGRQSQGLGYRAWSKIDEISFPEFDEAELNRIDLSDSLLSLYSLGVGDPRTFEWFEKPDPVRLEQALKLLVDLGAIDKEARLLPLGRKMYETGLPARAARMAIAARDGEISGFPVPLVKTYSAILSALLTEKDFVLDTRRFAEIAQHQCDLSARAELLIERNPRVMVDRIGVKTTLRVIDSYLEGPSVEIEKAIANWNEELVAALLLKGFPDRVARRRRAKSPQARMVGGRGVELHPSSSVREAEIFFALKGDAGVGRGSNDPMTTMASAVSKTLLEKRAPEFCSKRVGVLFDPETRTVYGERAMMYRDLPLEAGAREKPDSDEAFEILKREAMNHKDLVFNAIPTARFLARVRSLQASNETDLSENEIMSALDRALEERLYGQTSLNVLLSDDGSEALSEAWERQLSGLDADLSRRLEARTPSHFRAPTGNRFRIEYPEGRPPFVEVRLQELFGVSEHPMVAGVPLTFHLLGPNYRPVQVTADLPGFWRGSYFDVRKELRARYPKHSWPENPLEAPPEAKGHRRPR